MHVDRAGTSWIRDGALVGLSAALYAASFPPLALRACAWIALVPLLVAVRGTRPSRAAILGALWGVLAAELVGTWFATGVARYYGRPLPIGALFFAGVALLLAAPFFAAFTATYAALTRGVGDHDATGRPLARCPETLSVAMAWVACELARARFLVGNPWALLGYSQIGALHTIQIADVTGVFGVSFVLAAVNAAVACVLDRTTPARVRARELGVALAFVVVVVAYGVRALRAEPFPGPPLEVAIVQGNADVGRQWRPELYGAHLDTYLRLSRQVLADARPALVVWPEAAVTFFLEDEPAYRAAIGSVMRVGGARLVTGGPAHAADGPRYFNSAFLLDSNGEILDRYDKVHLMPFAEYFPFGDLHAVRRRIEQVREFTPGDDVRPLATSEYSIGVVICFEAMYPELVSRAVGGGARLLVNLTNDAWMGRTSFARQHLEIASLRAVETRRYLVRAASTGISAFVDPYGRIVGELGASEDGVRASTVRLLDVTTFYARFGDIFATACAAGTLVVLALARTRRRAQIPGASQ